MADDEDTVKMKKKIARLMASKEFSVERKAAVKKSHEFLKELEKNHEDISPLALTLFLSHTLMHVLMAAPEKHNLKEMLAIFLADLDFPDLLKAWANRQREGEQSEPHEEEEAHTIH